MEQLSRNENMKTVKTPETDAERAVREAGDVLGAFPRLPNGLTPDHVKFSPEYRAAKSRFDRAFHALRLANAARIKARRELQPGERVTSCQAEASETQT